MTHFFHSPLCVRSLTAAAWICCLMSAPALAAPDISGNSSSTGNRGSSGSGQTYRGYYALADQALAVDIDGVQYRGHYASDPAAEGAALPDGERGKAWGSAFLFASSAKVLQCRLDRGFPQMTGQCRDAEGREFRLRAASAP